MEVLYEEERKARVDGDINKLESIQIEILNRCSDDDEIIQVLKLLNNKRRQDSNCMKKLIKIVFDAKKSIEFYKSLLENVVEGKTYLEVERIYIADYVKCKLGNNIQEAYDVIKNIPVETFTSISDSEKNHFILEQFRLALLLKLYNEAELILRRAKQSSMTSEEKSIFLNYSIMLRIGQQSFLQASRLYYDLNKVDSSKANIALGSFFAIISNCLVEESNIIEEKRNLLMEFKENEMNDTQMRMIVESFCKSMILDFSFVQSVFEAVSKFSSKFPIQDDSDFFTQYESILRSSIIEHNFFVIKKYFSSIKIDQLCYILQISENEIITFISEMVNNKFSDVKINQQERSVNFGEKKWNSQIDDVLNKLVLANNLIHQESINKNL